MKAKIEQYARKVGFELFGVAAPCLDLEDEARLSAWLDEGHSASMNWMNRHKNILPPSLLPGARSVICLGLSYNLPDTTLPQTAGRVAKYARGRDYHLVIEKKLEDLMGFLKEEFGADSRSYVDHGPLLEKSFARRAGLGWVGKNTVLVNEKFGSFFFLGEIITTLELEPDHPIEEKCGDCRRCLEACPTKALTSPCVLSAGRCLSYLTVEHKGDMPSEFLTKMNKRLVGCDLCQTVCPYNLRAPMTREVDFRPVNEFLELEEVLSMEDKEFSARFAETSLKRVGLNRLKRNAQAIKDGEERV